MPRGPQGTSHGAYWKSVLGFFSPGLGNDEPERRTLGQSLARTDKFILHSSFFIEAGTKSLKYEASRVHTELTHNQ